MKPPQTAVLLAAGRGKRLSPYTDTMPKPLLPVHGRPTLDFVLEAAVRAGITQVCLVIGHLGHQIETYVGDGSRWHLNVAYCNQTELLGTAHALNIALNTHPHLFPTGQSFLLSATDYLLEPDFISQLVSAYQQTQADIVVSLKKMAADQLIGRSNIHYHDEFIIDQIVEKPTPDQITSPFSANLTYIIPTAIKSYLATMQPSVRGEYEVQTLLNQMISDGYRAQGVVQPIPAEWDSKFLY